jgi:hypothetical protein
MNELDHPVIARQHVSMQLVETLGARVVKQQACERCANAPCLPDLRSDVRGNIPRAGRYTVPGLQSNQSQGGCVLPPENSFPSSMYAGHLVESTIQRARSLRLPPPLSLRRMARRTIDAGHIANNSAIDLTTGNIRSGQ